MKVIKNEKNKSDLRIRKREKVREIEGGERVIMRENGWNELKEKLVKWVLGAATIYFRMQHWVTKRTMQVQVTTNEWANERGKDWAKRKNNKWAKVK